MKMVRVRAMRGAHATITVACVDGVAVGVPASDRLAALPGCTS